MGIQHLALQEWDAGSPEASGQLLPLLRRLCVQPSWGAKICVRKGMGKAIVLPTQLSAH